MRPLKELLQILLDEVERNGVDRGLCFDIHNLWLRDDKINLEEKFFLEEYIESFLGRKIWLFPQGETAPRIEFLKNEISKL